MAVLFWYVLAAAAEIAGCYAFWAVLRLGRSPLLLLPGLACLVVFAAALSRVDSAFAGRAFAAYAGIYLLASLALMMLIERQGPDRYDLIGSLLALLGAGFILLGPRGP